MRQFADSKCVSAAMVIMGLLAGHAAAQAVRGTVTDVTVFRDQALVTRAVEVAGAKGPVEIVVSDLPENLVPASLSAEALDPACRVHSVTYRARAVPGDARPEVKVIDERIAELNRTLRELEARRGAIEAKQQAISALAAFTVATAQTEIQKGVLDFEQLRQLADYALEKQDSLVQQGLEVDVQKEEIVKQLELEQRRRAELASELSETEREALIHLTKEVDEAAAIALRYLVSRVSWRPQYNFRSSDERNVVTVEYNAVVNQMSGEDWTNVRLSLSTAQPAFSAESPAIVPLRVALGPQEVLAEEQVEAELKGLSQQRAEVQQSVQPAPAEQAYTLNVLAGKEQVLELAQRGPRAEKRPARPEGVSASYELPHAATLASRTDEQILQIAAATVPAESRHIAVPVLTSFVYIEAAAQNETPYVLLPGPYNAYLDGRFVGRGMTPLVAAGEEFTAGFGVDSQVQVTRELASKTEAVEGGNIAWVCEYRLTIANYHPQPVRLTLEDRIPYSEDGSVQVKLLEVSPKLSEDPEYQRMRAPKGLLRWDLEIPPLAIKDNPVIVSYKFHMAHERQMAITGLLE